MILVASCVYGAEFDLILKGGHVIDPKNGVNAVRDIAIRGGRVANVAEKLESSRATKTVDVTGLYVTPGLVDIHVHVFSGAGLSGGTGKALSVWPDSFGPRSCTTTMVDAGTSGHKRFEEFRNNVLEKNGTRVLALLNIVGAGMAGKPEQDTNEMDVSAAVAMAKRYPDRIVGFKTSHYAGTDWTAVERVVAAGTKADLPVMVDFGQFRKERPFQQLVLEKLRPGDMYTHTYLSAVPILDEKGTLLPYLEQAKKRGVKFDMGHGMGSFLFRLAAPAIRQGFVVDSISSDLHGGNMNGPMHSMPNLMTKVLALGRPLDDVILRSTWNPAQQIRRPELGHLTVGATADVAVFSLATGQFGLVDVWGGKLTAKQSLQCEMTLSAGKFTFDLNGRTRTEWTNLPAKYGNQSDGLTEGIIESPSFALSETGEKKAK
jgi:dihydroorotase